MTVIYKNVIIPVIRPRNTLRGLKKAKGRLQVLKPSLYQQQTILIGKFSFKLLTREFIVACVKDYRFFPVHI